ncbi:MAG: hypothetical protein ACHQ6U_10560, partial [Thermodesulfobacteriota bacterium]
MRLERERVKMDKEVESRLRKFGIESAEDTVASKDWWREREELLERAASERERLQNEITERESR